MIETALNRRDFIFVLSGFIGTLSLSPETLWADGAQTLSLPTAIGDLYLQLFGEDSELKALKAKIQGSVNSLIEQKAVLADVRALISEDHLKRRTFEFENWVLSKTEGRLCALAFLELPQRSKRPTS